MFTEVEEWVKTAGTEPSRIGFWLLPDAVRPARWRPPPILDEKGSSPFFAAS
jgi:hypothetical protein